MPRQRIITAAVLIFIITAAVILLDTRGFAVLLALVVGLAAWEWSGLMGLKKIPYRHAYVILILAILLGEFLFRDGMTPVYVMLTATVWWFLVIGGVVGYQHGQTGLFNDSLLKAVAGILVLAPAWLGMVILQDLENTRWNPVLCLLFLVWIADSAAYFGGRRWGNTKLCDKISPGKTWAGLNISLFATAIAALVFAIIVKMQGVEIMMFLILCLITILASIVGDLLESIMKRSVSLKDSGNLLPGHGGIMDRIDSLTAACPVFLTGLWLLEIQV